MSLPPQKTFSSTVESPVLSPTSMILRNFYSDVIRYLLRTDTVQRSCVFSVLPAVTNLYNGLLGGAIGAIAERVAFACTRTVVADNKNLFVGELSISYLSAAPQGEELVVNGSVVRSGRNFNCNRS